jgi:hypothetical protein
MTSSTLSLNRSDLKQRLSMQASGHAAAEFRREADVVKLLGLC